MWLAISCRLPPTLALPLCRGLAAKAGKASKAPLASTAQAKSEAASTSESEAKPAVDYPDWVAGLTKPGKTLGELRRTSEDDRTMVDNVRFEKLRQRASIKSRNFSKAKGV